MGRNHGAARAWRMSRPSAGADAAASRRYGSEPVRPAADVGPSWLGRAFGAPELQSTYLLEELVGVHRLGCLCRVPVVCTRTHAKAAHPRAEPGCNMVPPGCNIVAPSCNKVARGCNIVALREPRSRAARAVARRILIEWVPFAPMAHSMLRADRKCCISQLPSSARNGRRGRAAERRRSTARLSSCVACCAQMVRAGLAKRCALRVAQPRHVAGRYRAGGRRCGPPRRTALDSVPSVGKSPVQMWQGGVQISVQMWQHRGQSNIVVECYDSPRSGFAEHVVSVGRGLEPRTCTRITGVHVGVVQLGLPAERGP